MRKLEGKRAVVTGGAKGIGRAICLLMASEGALVGVAGGKDIEGVNETLEAIYALGGEGVALCADLTDEKATNNLFDSFYSSLGGIDILINNAGGKGVNGPLESLTAEQWDTTFNLNAKSAFLCSNAAARKMIVNNSGSIINIAGASAHRCFPGNGAYGPSKAAVISLTRQSSLEWAKYGIRVNAISPGPIRDANIFWQKNEPKLAQEVQLIPLRRAGTYEEIAKAACFLSSEDASYITGHSLIVDGGGVNTWYISQSISNI